MPQTRFNGFIGESYRALSPAAAGDRADNLIPEVNESGTGVSPMQFYNRPGLKLFTTLPTKPVLTLYSGNNRLFAFGGNNPGNPPNLYEVYSDGSLRFVGVLGLPSTREPAVIVSDGNELAIYDGGNTLYVDTGVGISIGLQNIRDVTYLNGYFIALRDLTINNGTQINLSALFNAQSWDPLDFAIRTTTVDQIQRIVSDHSQLWLLGKKTINVWTPIDPGTSGAFPFVDYPEGAIAMGVWARWSVAYGDESIFMLAGDDRGVPVVIRINGYTPQRISDFALEQEMERYVVAGVDTSDAEGYIRADAGHMEYVLSFPTANVTRVYDISSRKWHNEGYWDGSSFDPETSQSRIRGHCHAYAAPAQAGPGPYPAATHYVGDYQTGKIYSSSIDYFDDDGQPVLYQRTSPHLNLNNLVERHVSFEALMEQGDVTAAPTAYLEISSKTLNGKRVYGPPLPVLLAGPTDNPNQKRAWWRRLGRARDRMYRLTRTDSNRQAWLDAFIRVNPGNGA